jgi:short subunit dehydrogenase-like uncharacterized protein
MGRFLIYGASGYTGQLTARTAAARGLKPVLAGRTLAGFEPLAKQLGLETRAFSLDDPVAVDAGLAGMDVVLHCAGPFMHTSKAMADACLRTKTHYLDITGEVVVFESLHKRDAEARAAGVLLLPGAGFDVVPSDCLAAHLKRRLPSATHLTLAFQSTGSLSRGTATTMIEGIDKGGLVRRDGRLTRVPSAYKTKAIDYGRGPRTSVTIPWGDVSTAFHSTGIPNIEVYLAAPTSSRVSMRLARVFGPLLGTAPVQRFLKARVRAGAAGPSDEARARARCYLWGEAVDKSVGYATSRLQTPEGYTLTALTSLAIVERVLAGGVPVGFQTPSGAFGPDFVLGIEGVARQDL